ncbi:DUF2935 domain-containing protein [Chengkuizengella axinellae]|uniref:DUF2935 domain-containing protein n=1 Tax=Chengkuizengella axinellae TaxID=3064388 RepID=A0ABT9J457_9BACL|nr:DUF2935 domain-containing protein [Chengkuizengella sp. 2205SS18-9]MDP5276430.1 DUF2935 domain-containing protein [Chengkuizengella sp. 2205SS18-9]
MNNHFEVTAWEEHQFWLEILEDHAHFIHDFLSPSEEKWIGIANQYITSFRALRSKLNSIDPKHSFSSIEMRRFSTEVYPVAEGFYKFEGHLQHLRLQNKVNLNMWPSYLNGTLSENREYLRILSFSVRGQIPTPLPLVDLLDLWLEDHLGHAQLFIDIMDPSEIFLIQQAEKSIQEFRAHMVKNRQIKGYLIFTAPGFPVQTAFAKDVSKSVISLFELVEKLVEKYKGTEVLNRSTLRFIEHHFPESCYFLRKLAFYNPDIYQIPNCPLTKPSFPIENE